jgi:serine protease Do
MLPFGRRKGIIIISVGGIGLGLLFVILINFSIRTNAPRPSLEPHSLADLVEPLLPAVVSISTTPLYREQGKIQPPFNIPVPQGHLLEEFLRELFEQMQTERSFSNIGSGFIIDHKGHIVTSNSIVENANQIWVILNDKTELKATLTGRDPRTDLAVLKVKTDKKLPFIQWGESKKLRVGDQVIAIGNPFGLAGTVTTGIISYINHDINGRFGGIGEYIQTDAAINLGSTGGPLCDMKGKAVGMNVSFFPLLEENTGVGFAIPSNVAKKIIEQILRYGRVKRGWLGINVQALTDDIREDIGLKSLKGRGVLVNNISENGPAAKAHLRRGDVILKLGNKKINNQRALLRIVEDLPIGSQTSATIFRRGKFFSLPIQVGEAIDPSAIPLDADKGGVRGIEINGMILQGLSGDTRRQFNVSCEVQGVLVAMSYLKVLLLKRAFA